MNLHTNPAQEASRVCIGKMRFWDEVQHHLLVPHISAKEQIAIWDAVAVYIQNQLLLRKGVRIPTLGSFEVVPTKAGDGALVLQRPVFRLARNLVRAHNLAANAEYQPGHKECELIQYAVVAGAASVSWQKAESCVRDTVSLMSHCLQKGENTALVLKDVGVLLIEGTRVQMKFYYNFLERLSGKKNLEEAFFKIPRLMDMTVSQVAAVASLTFSGRVIIFPELVMEAMPKPPPRKPIRVWGKESLPLPRKDKKDARCWLQEENQSFPPGKHGPLQKRQPPPSITRLLAAKAAKRSLYLDKLKKAYLTRLMQETAEVPSPADATSSTARSVRGQAAEPVKGKAEERKKKSGPRGRKRPGADKAMPSQQSRAPTLSPEPNYREFRVQLPRVEISKLLQARPEVFWSVLQQPQKTILSGYSFDVSCLHPSPCEEPSSRQCWRAGAGLPPLGRPRPQ
ncbi:hypothetical protein ASZ78_010978 [Callipepla squamata]|uniref:CCDC81 HU domain-containing protein n=1 Tax=Callipepla squamata TaxID=9009 RepID=A0A226NES7_CALSU|nr:hypothetical protein ASZ78_010978 [Callipepla squamata]